MVLSIPHGLVTALAPMLRRASIPVFTAIGSVVIEKRPPSRQEFLSLIVLVGGVSIAVWEGSGTKASFYGVVLCIIGTLRQVEAARPAAGWPRPLVVTWSRILRERCLWTAQRGAEQLLQVTVDDFSILG